MLKAGTLKELRYFALVLSTSFNIFSHLEFLLRFLYIPFITLRCIVMSMHANNKHDDMKYSFLYITIVCFKQNANFSNQSASQKAIGTLKFNKSLLKILQFSPLSINVSNESMTEWYRVILILRLILYIQKLRLCTEIYKYLA